MPNFGARLPLGSGQSNGLGTTGSGKITDTLDAIDKATQRVADPPLNYRNPDAGKVGP